MGIFAENAPKYWAAGLPVFPLLRGMKVPAISGWQVLGDSMPTLEKQQEWLTNFPDGNIGLATGAAAGLVAIDIDRDDPEIVDALMKILPVSPWVRVGAKGKMLIYRFNGEQNSNIRDSDGKMIVEIKSKGTQIVLPPSIHPDTGREYVENASLIEIKAAAVDLPKDFAKLVKTAMAGIGIEVSVAGKHKIASYVPAGARDNAMTYHAGLLARAIMRGERTLVQALGEIEEWVKTFTEKVVGDDVSIEKAQSKIVEFLVKDVAGERRQALPPNWDEGLAEDDKKALGLSFTEDDEQWPADKILGYLQAEFERFADDKRASGRVNAVQVALDRIARAGPTISALEEGMILKFIASQSAGAMGLPDLKRQLSMLRRGDIEGDNHKELAQATVGWLERFGEVRYDAGQFWQWRGAFWASIGDFEILKIIAQEFGDYPGARKQSDHSGVLKVMRSIASKPLRQVMSHGMNLANGFLNEDLVLEPHQPDHGMTYILPYRYLPELTGHSPMFNQYLVDSWGDDPDFGDKLACLQEAMGATLFSRATSYQRAICLFGQSGSGKSRLTAIMRGLLPPSSVSSIPPHEWRDKFLPAGMFGKVLNFAGELSESKNIPGDIFKQIIEGEEISGQHKNQQPFTFRPLCAQWFSSNHLPKTRDFSDGFNRRWLFLEWKKRVPLDKIIPDLDKIILEHEREAIVAWAVEGWHRLKEQGQYTLPTSHLALIDQMAMDNNSVRYFLQACPGLLIGKDRMIEGRPTSVSATDLHGEYWKFCLNTNTNLRVGLNNFVKMMNELQPNFRFTERIVRDEKSGHTEVWYDNVMRVAGI